MFSYVERLLAFRYLRSRKQDGFISVISGFSLVGIALGVGTLIVVMAVMNGFRHELIGRILGVDGHVDVVGRAEGIPDYEALLPKIREQDYVKAALPMVEGQVMVMANDQATGAMVLGIRGEDLDAKPMLVEGMKLGDFSNFTDGRDGVVIGHRLARKLGVTVGGEITLVSPRTRATIMGAIPILKAYPVAGIFDVGMIEYDSGLVLMPLADAQRYFQMPDRVNTIEVTLHNPLEALARRNQMYEVVPQHYRVVDWQRMHGHFVNALQVERNVMFLILSLIIMVAAFNIISSLIMLVKDKETDIAILRTMGATRGAVMRMFFLSGASVGVIGTVLGVVLGLAFALNIESIRQWLEGLTGTELFAAEIYFLSKLPAIVEWHEVVQVGGMALLLTFIATLYPSWRAAKTDPAEVLRYG